MIFLFPRWDMLVPWRVSKITANKKKNKKNHGWNEVLDLPSAELLSFTLERVAMEVSLERDGGTKEVRLGRNPQKSWMKWTNS